MEPVLAVDDIQGNLLGGFNKDFQALIHIAFGADVAAAKALLRTMPITTLSEVVTWRRAAAQMQTTGRVGTPPDALWTSVSLSWAGMAKLSRSAQDFTDATFKSGMDASSSSALGDPITPGQPGQWGAWIVGGGSGTPDMLVIIGADAAADLQTSLAATLASVAAAGCRVLHQDIGRNLATYSDAQHVYSSGHEHFGFKDGISQPGIRGTVSAGANDWLTPRMAGQPGGPGSVEYGLQGEALIQPGEFVLGYPTQDDVTPRAAAPPAKLGAKPGQPLVAEAVAPWWAANGSFLVFRRLRQDVAGFRAFVAAAAGKIATDLGGAADEEKTAARLVGRWRSGAPVELSPAADDPALGADNSRNNTFDFAGDTEGAVCPLGAHVRKVNARAVGTDLGVPSLTLKHRILRRGIAYGAPLPDGLADDGQDRGLLFLSYQADIVSQFQFLQSQWANRPNVPVEATGPGAGADPNGDGYDMVIGQQRTGNRARFLVIRTDTAASRVSTDAFMPKDWVVSTGGAFFFTPSISAIKTVLGAP